MGCHRIHTLLSLGAANQKKVEKHCSRGYVIDFKGCAKFMSYATLNNFFKTLWGYAHFYFYVWGYVSTKKSGTAAKYMYYVTNFYTLTWGGQLFSFTGHIVPRGPNSSQIWEFKANKLAYTGRMWPCLHNHSNSYS